MPGDREGLLGAPGRRKHRGVGFVSSCPQESRLRASLRGAGEGDGAPAGAAMGEAAAEPALCPGFCGSSGGPQQQLGKRGSVL